MHGLANTAVLSLQLGSLSARVRGRTGRGRMLSAMGLVLAGAAAYLGGDLVLDRALTVNHTSSLAGPGEWTDAADDADITEGALTAVDIDNRRVSAHTRQRQGLRAREHLHPRGWASQ